MVLELDEYEVCWEPLSKGGLWFQTDKGITYMGQWANTYLAGNKYSKEMVIRYIGLNTSELDNNHVIAWLKPRENRVGVKHGTRTQRGRVARSRRR